MEIKKEYAPLMADIFRALPQTLFIKDTEGRYAFTTKVCDLVNAGPEGTIIGKTDCDIQFDKEIGYRYLQEDLEIVRTGISTHSIDSFYGNDGKHYIEVTKNPIYNDDKEIVGIIGICNDLTELINLRERYEHISLHDTLTGLYNRNYSAKYDFDNEASLPCSYIVCDCNELKMINDKYGHRAGDLYIQENAHLLEEMIPGKSVAIRWGGDEFVVITPHCTKEMHEALVNSIRTNRKKFNDAEPETGLAVGGALRKSLDIPITDILKKADERMYADKVLIKKGCCKIS